MLAAYGLEPRPDDPPEALLADLCARRGLFLPGGRPDRNRAAETLLHDFRKGLLGRHTFEDPSGP